MCPMAFFAFHFCSLPAESNVSVSQDPRMRLTTALSQYCLQLRADGRSPHTIAQAQRHPAQMIQYLGAGRPVGSVTSGQLARFLTLQKTTRRSDGVNKKASSMNALRSSLRSFFTFATHSGFVTVNPTYLLRRAKCAPRPPGALTIDEQRRLLQTVATAHGPESRRDYLLYHLLLSTGIRIGSALNLDWRDVDFERGELLLTKTKGNRPEAIALSPAFLLHLWEARGERISGPLFTNYRGGRLGVRHVQRRLKYWLSAAGILTVASPHAFRHSFAMNLYHASHDLLLVKEALRHRSVASTQIYARAADTTVRTAISNIDPGAGMWPTNTNHPPKPGEISVA